jgi:hypothetical protein
MVLPEHLKLTANEQAQLDSIKVKAKERHERARKTAKRAGREDFPVLPYECSWAFEEEFRREVRQSTRK